jgi:hypothetical protein
MRYYLLLFTFLLCAVFFGCSKEPVVKSTNISNAQAAVMVATALSFNSYGLAAIKTDFGLYAHGVANAGKGCGVLDTLTIARQEPTTSNINYNYAFAYYYTVNCVNNLQDNLTSAVTYTGSFDAPSLSVLNTANASFNISSLATTTGNYTFNGAYQTTGSFQTLDETQLTGNSTINITTGNLLVAKPSRSIVSGTASINLSGTLKSNKNTFSYNGTIVFQGGNTALLTLEGVNYSINLTTADVTAQ